MINLNQGDSIVFMKNLPNESVDLIITSPPYCMEKNMKVY